ncbi:MAG: zf-HC2 domain-containing protein [Gemmatimonadota bacterium]
MHERFNEQLSAYLDGELPEADRASLEGHLLSCAGCSQALAELRRVVAWAPGFQGTAPKNDLWSSIEPLLARRTSRGQQKARERWSGRQVTIRLPHLLAAGIALILLSAGTMWLARSHGTENVGQVGTPAPRSWDYVRASATERQYDQAVAELEGILASGDTALDPATLKVIRGSLVAIDRAIQEAREAITRDSTNDYLNASIAANMRRKLDILRTAAQAVAAKS